MKKNYDNFDFFMFLEVIGRWVLLKWIYPCQTDIYICVIRESAGLSSYLRNFNIIFMLPALKMYQPAKAWGFLLDRILIQKLISCLIATGYENLGRYVTSHKCEKFSNEKQIYFSNETRGVILIFAMPWSNGSQRGVGAGISLRGRTPKQVENHWSRSI